MEIPDFIRDYLEEVKKEDEILKPILNRYSKEELIDMVIKLLPFDVKKTLIIREQEIETEALESQFDGMEPVIYSEFPDDEDWMHDLEDRREREGMR